MYLLPRIQIINEVENIALVTKDWYNSVFYSSKKVAKSKERKITIKRESLNPKNNQTMLSLIRLSFLENCTIFRDCYLLESFLTPSSSSKASKPSLQSAMNYNPQNNELTNNINENYIEQIHINEIKYSKNEQYNRGKGKRMTWRYLRKYKKIVDIFYYLTMFGVLLLCTVSYPIFYFLELYSMHPYIHSYRPANPNIGMFDWNVIEWFFHVLLLICCYFVLSSPLPSLNLFSFFQKKKKKPPVKRKKKLAHSSSSSLSSSSSSLSSSSSSLSSPSSFSSSSSMSSPSNPSSKSANHKIQNNLHSHNALCNQPLTLRKSQKKKNNNNNFINRENEYDNNEIQEEKQPFRNSVWSIPFQCIIVMIISIRFLRYFENFWFPLYNLVTFFMLLTFEHSELVFVCSKIFVKYPHANNHHNHNNNNNSLRNSGSIYGSNGDKTKFLHAKVFEEIDQSKISQSITYFLTQSITAISIMFTAENNYNIILFSCITGAISFLILIKLTKYGIREVILLFSFVSVCIFSVSFIYSIIYFICKYSVSLTSIFSLSLFYTAAPPKNIFFDFANVSTNGASITFCQLCRSHKTALFSFESFLIVLATFAQNFFLYLLQHCAATLWKSAPIRITRYCNIFFSDHPSLIPNPYSKSQQLNTFHYSDSEEISSDESSDSDEDIDEQCRMNKRTYLSHNQMPYMWLTGAVIFFVILLLSSILFSVLKFYNHISMNFDESENNFEIIQ